MMFVRRVASTIATIDPAKNIVQVVGLIAPCAMMRNSAGKSRKWVNDGTSSPRALKLGSEVSGFESFPGHAV
jgi:hypothetical protein